MSLRGLWLVVGITLIVPTVVWSETLPGDPDVEKAQRKVESLEKKLEVAMEKMSAEISAMRDGEEYQKARKDRDYQKTRELTEAIRKPVIEKWRKKYETAAKKFEGTEGEIPFAASMIENRLAADMPKLIQRMVENHAASPNLRPVAKRFTWAMRMDKEELWPMLQKVIDQNPDVEIQAYAHFARATSIRYDRQASDDAKAQMDKDYDRVIALLPEDNLLSMKARGPEFEKTRLQIGMKAPDIEGVDIDGVAFKLSDYHGKVVMLDFWGHW